jgi:3-hydroxyisobutyrate dehydrogenase-like beta-hydroxyacid dehydrogenase
MNITFLGTGIMGGPMAANLARAGNTVRVWNRTKGKAKVEGTTWVDSPRAGTEGAEVVWLCLSDTAAVEEVLGGADGVIAAAQPGLIVADSSTISPRASRELAERLAEKGASMVDCPVTGSRRGAEAGELVFIVGGPEVTVAKLDPLFKAMGKRVFAMGANGMGLATKLAMNLNIALIYQGFCEGLVLAEKSGVSAEQMIEIIGSTMLRSGVTDYKGEAIKRRDFTPNFPLRLMLKDIHLMLDHAREMRVKLPALETVEEVYAVANEEGMGELDYAASLALLEKWAGLPGGDLGLAAD